MAHMYALTQFTGRRRNDDRQVTISVFAEMNRRTFFVCLISSVAGLVLALPLMLVLGALTTVWWVALLITPLATAAGWWLFDTRARDQLGVHRFRHLLDARAASAMRGIRIAGQPLIQPSLTMVTTQYLDAPPSTAPVARGVRVRKQGKASFYA